MIKSSRLFTSEKGVLNSINKLPVPPLCSPKYLNTKLNTSEVSSIVPIDGSWFMPNVKRDPTAEFKSLHIKNSRYFNIDLISDKSLPFPHMLPTVSQFETYMTENNVGAEDEIVVYDSSGIFSSCRLFWTLKVFGHEKVSLLNGGLPNWLHNQYETTDLPFKPVAKEPYKVNSFNPDLLTDYDQVLKLVNSKNKPEVNILDARPGPRFTGSSPEPRPELSSGHMPYSINLPFQNLLQSPNNFSIFKTQQELNQLFKTFNKDFNPTLTTVTSCGSGVTASIIFFALKYGQYYDVDSCVPTQDFVDHKVNVFDGSWSQYAAMKSSPIIKD